MREMFIRLDAVVRPSLCVNAMVKHGEIFTLFREALVMMPRAKWRLSDVRSLLAAQQESMLVYANVLVPLMKETLTAVRATRVIRRVSSRVSGALVTYEAPHMVKAFTTEGAAEGPLSSVNALVSHKTSQPRERLAAQVTLVVKSLR